MDVAAGSSAAASSLRVVAPNDAECEPAPRASEELASDVLECAKCQSRLNVSRPRGLLRCRRCTTSDTRAQVASIFSQCKVNSRSGPGVLIAHSGGGSIGSRCLLRFVSLMRGSDVEGGDRRRMIVPVTVCIVTMPTASAQELAAAAAAAAEVRDWGIAQVVVCSACEELGVDPAAVQATMAAAPARAHEVKELLLLRCLASVARRHNCNMILSGDTLESTAAAALCHVAAGRGSALLSRAAVDSFDCGARMRVIRPLRNIMRIECQAALAELAHVQQQGDVGVECVAAAQAVAVDAAAKSIGDLMTAFVSMLQDDKCTTAATLVRAVEKLAPCPTWPAPAAAAGAGAAAPAAVHPACPLCRLPVVYSLDFRHFREDSAGALDAGADEALLCYSCKTLHMHDAAAVTTLMRGLGSAQELRRRVTGEEMREQLQEFILDDTA